MRVVSAVNRKPDADIESYTMTYTPSLDRILPLPSHLHVRIRNTSAIPLRAAYIVGPYTLYAACYPSNFDPNHKNDAAAQDGAPEFEPNLKAGGAWASRLPVPKHIREPTGEGGPASADGSAPSVTWVIDISSQVIFSMSAAVHFELLVGRDEKSVELGFAGLGSKSGASPGQLEDHKHHRKTDGVKHHLHHHQHPKGIFSPAVGLLVEDTDSLWNKPAFPTWQNQRHVQESGRVGSISQSMESSPLANQTSATSNSIPDDGSTSKQQKQKKLHLVVLTHGLHSNLGSDLLYLKESIDTAAKQAKEDARRRKRRQRNAEQRSSTADRNVHQNGQDELPKVNSEIVEEPELAGSEEEESDEEEVIVRGFPGNACRTERGIQYLGKRLAKWVLSVTYPDQEYLPQKQSVRKKLSRVLTGDQQSPASIGKPQHNHSSIYHPAKKAEAKPYKITSISFIAHSLGGLTQTYAIAYIHKHSPHFFEEIRPINFVAMAAPFLGLSNENPLYVRFALDFGLVGRTGQDLGLAWRAPTMVRSGWGAMIGGTGTEGRTTQKRLDPGSKPLLRILPTGHTHQVLKLFRNRTIYSNVVNDGIVPLRTSCLLFLDWSGLGRVEKARRGNGLIGTTLGWGWAELTGVNSSSRAQLRAERDSEAWSQSDISNDEQTNGSQTHEARAQVPQPPEDAVTEDNAHEKKTVRSRSADFRGKSQDSNQEQSRRRRSSVQHQLTSPISGLLSLLRPNSQRSPNQSPKQTRIYKRGQTTRTDPDENVDPLTESPSISRSPSPFRQSTTAGDEDPQNVFAPPKTSFFESAGDILSPPLPTKEFLIDPSSRPRTIFHDRVYHPEDIPPPPAKRPGRLSRSSSSDSRNGLPKVSNTGDGQRTQTEDLGGMKVEEKIARAYHHGLSWRKVLVRLEPDAHNNMVVRRMFANAYGWPVVKHLVDTHFADTYEANTADIFEPSKENAVAEDEDFDGQVDVVDTSGPINAEIRRTDSEMREAIDSITDLRNPKEANSKSSSYSSKLPSLSREDSAQWDDALFDITDDSDEDVSERQDSRRSSGRPHISLSIPPESPKGTSEAEIADFLTKSPMPADPLSPSNGDIVPSAPAGSTAAVGLGKSLEQQLHVKSPEEVTAGADGSGAATARGETRRNGKDEAGVADGRS